MRALALALLGALAAALLPLWAAQAAPEPAPEAREVLVLVRLPPEHYRPGGGYGGAYGDDLSREAERRLAGRIAHAHGLTLVDDWPMPLLGLDCFVMAAPATQTAEQAAEALSRDPGVAWSEPMHVYKAEAQGAGHNDPLFRAQPAAREWRLAELHRYATGRKVSVAVIDSQVEANHPDLQGQVAVAADFGPTPARTAEIHGTGVAGVIAARADNGIGIVGVAPQARLMALRACWQQGAGASTTVCDTLSLAKALHFAIEHRAQVINLSLAGPPDMLLGKLVDVALARGVSVVAAYDPKLPRGGFPASHKGVIAVADESLAALQPGVYSAPGRDVPTTQPGGRWSLVDGSSYAAAHVSGLMALARERTGGAGLTLVSIRPGGGMIDACATVGHGARLCAPATGESLVSLRP
jgi:subtilisin family serine protease